MSGPSTAASPTRAERRRGPLLVAIPAAAWMLAFFVIPLVIFGIYSFLTAQLYGVETPFTLQAYRVALTDPINRTLAWNSIVVGTLTATVCLGAGLPIAYWLRFVADRSRLAVLFLITASMFASYLVRIYAWRTMLGRNGVINKSLKAMGVIDEPLDFILYNRFAVVIALVHIFLPYVVLVLYAGMNPVSPSLLEAGQDLGASSSLIWRRVLLPIMAAPSLNAFVFVFVLSASDYVTPQFLGGTSGATIGVRVQTAFITLGNWPLAAATSFLMLLSFGLMHLLGTAVLRGMRLHDIRLAA